MILKNGKIMTTHEILASIEEIGMPLPIDLNDPIQRAELDRRLSRRDGKGIATPIKPKEVLASGQTTVEGKDT